MLVTVHFLFSRNHKIGSKFISWGTKHLYSVEETPSHVAVLVNNRWVHESTLETGVRVISYGKWLEKNIELCKVPGKSMPYKTISTIFKRIKSKKYDWMGVVYLGYRIALNKYFKVDLPSTNMYESKERYFCSEVVGKLTNKDYGMKAPVQIMLELQ